ncbi:MAG TPA: translation initiation factor IF-2 [Leucothrix mucor]|nr:translation initiation factor IF-2 [Leucothrix mucor]
MSETSIKQLAELTGTPVEDLLKKLQTAGMKVSGADDTIPDAVVDLIKMEQSSSAPAKKTLGKMSLKSRETTEIDVATSHGKNSVSVEVKRKKSFSLPIQAPVTTPEVEAEKVATTSSRTEELSEQLSKERKARENASAANKQAKEDRKIASEERKAQKEADNASKKAEYEKSKESDADVSENAVDADVSDNAVKEESVATETAAPEEPVKPVVPLTPKEQREALATAARAEAASALKKRPSRKRPEPVARPAPANKPGGANAAPANANANKGKKKPFQGRSQGPGQLHVKAGHSGRRKKKGKRSRNVTVDQSTDHGFEKPTEPVIHNVEIPETIVVSELAQKLTVKGADVIMAMMNMGVMATINQVIDQDTAILIVEEMGHTATAAITEEEETSLDTIIEDVSGFEASPRPPVVTIMGHVDHGKTSLLDYIRESRVASGEAGGITQHIGAYQVETDNGVISFLDTPGHAAFSNMRSRGAKATDIVIIVVAADDGVMPQTEEAIKHTRAAGVPLIVAINKIDIESADIEKVKGELSKFEVIPEDWGGEDIFVNISAKTGEGIDSLLESILLAAEILELKVRTEGPATGTVIESRIEKGRGAVATVLVQAGTLKKGDVVLVGSEYGRIRAMTNDLGKNITEAGPSAPIEILGLSGTPSSGDELAVLKNERQARELAQQRHEKERETRFAAQQAAKLDAMFEKMQAGEKSIVPVLLKADVHGSAEAIKNSLMALSTSEVEVKMITSGVGGISETDVNLAQAAEAVIIGFNVRADAAARRLASESGVEIRYYSIIYEVIDDIRDAMSGLLKPELREELIGVAEVKDVFTGSGFGNIAGCLVIEGTIKKGEPIRVLRNDVVVYEGELESLRRHQDDVKKVAMGTECGIGVKNYDDIKAGDKIEVFTRTEIERSLSK